MNKRIHEDVEYLGTNILRTYVVHMPMQNTPYELEISE